MKLYIFYKNDVKFYTITYFIVGIAKRTLVYNYVFGLRDDFRPNNRLVSLFICDFFVKTFYSLRRISLELSK